MTGFGGAGAFSVINSCLNLATQGSHTRGNRDTHSIQCCTNCKKDYEVKGENQEAKCPKCGQKLVTKGGD